MMEKFDGRRVFWDGKRLLDANTKKEINVPKDVIESFPTVAFEGELWYEYFVLISLTAL
jgi:hypothetical protein